MEINSTVYLVIGLAAVSVVCGYVFGGFEWFRKYFSDSETIVIARLQVVLGILMAANVADVLPDYMTPWYMVFIGVMTEVARRLRADDV